MYLYGASGHCKVIIDILRSKPDYILEGIHDDSPKVSTVMGIPVRTIDFNQEHELIISIGCNSVRKKISENINARFITAIDVSATISLSVAIGEGTVVMPNCIINAESKIGRHCIINSGAIIEHDCNIEDYAHISPGAALAGNVIVGEGTHIGINAAVIPGITIGKWSTIGAGSVIISNVPDYAVVVGNPGKVIKYNDSPKSI